MTYEEIFAKSKELVGKSDVSNMDGHLAVQNSISRAREAVRFILSSETNSFSLSPTNSMTETVNSPCRQRIFLSWQKEKWMRWLRLPSAS